MSKLYVSKMDSLHLLPTRENLHDLDGVRPLDILRVRFHKVDELWLLSKLREDTPEEFSAVTNRTVFQLLPPISVKPLRKILDDMTESSTIRHLNPDECLGENPLSVKMNQQSCLHDNPPSQKIN